MFSLPILLLHGLGERTFTFYLFLEYLRQLDITNVVTPHWPANTCQMPDECVAQLESSTAGLLNKSEPMIVIGNSMGGVLAYHLPNYGWNVQKAFYVAAPLNGTYIVKQLREWERAGSINTGYARALVGKGAVDYLSSGHDLQPPNHSYWTITPRLPYLSYTDSHILVEEGIIEDTRNVPITWSSHFALAIDGRAWSEITARIVVPEYENLSPQRQSDFVGLFLTASLRVYFQFALSMILATAGLLVFVSAVMYSLSRPRSKQTKATAPKQVERGRAFRRPMQ